MIKKLHVIVAFAAMIAGGSAAAQSQQITLEDIWVKRTFAPKGIGSTRSMADGEHYLAMTRTGIAKYSYVSGEKVADVCLFSTPDMSKRARPLPIFEGYEMSLDEQKILLSSGFEPIYRHSGVSDYHLYDVKSGSFTKLTNRGKQRLTTLSPDGTKVAFVRDNNLYWMDISTLEEHQITTDGRLNHIIYGTTDWVYEEEFAITRGFQWSPDSKKIAYLRFDESSVKEYNMQMWGALYPEDYKYKYPKAGEDNSEVSLHVYSLEDKSYRTLEQVGKAHEWEYLPRFQWVDQQHVAYIRMNRLQNRMQVMVDDGESNRLLYAEESEAYVEVPDTWQFIAPTKKHGTQMLITSERSGFRQVYLCAWDGTLVKQLTTGDYEVCAVVGVDEKNSRIYYTSREHGAINQSLSMVEYGGKQLKTTCLNFKPTDMAAFDMLGIAFTMAQGKYVTGTYNAQFSQGCKYYICTYSNADLPPVYSLHDRNGKLVKVLENNAELRQRMIDYGARRKTFGTFRTSRGTELNYYTIRPHDFDEQKQYPVLIYVYGGPGNQQVTNSYGYSDHYWYHLLAEKGYIVFCFDGRGTGGRGAQFKKQTYGDLGRMESEDAIAAARWLGDQSWVDEERIGIWGWSFGGYLSTLSLLKGNDVFKMAIAVAPVMTWRYYDNIYTERFLGLPKDNAKGYDDNSPLTYADRLQGNYLLIHGTGDDNVHFQNSADMIDRLEKAGKQFEMRIYPNKNHSIYDATGQTRLNLYQLMTDFILRKL